MAYVASFALCAKLATMLGEPMLGLSGPAPFGTKVMCWIARSDFLIGGDMV